MYIIFCWSRSRNAFFEAVSHDSYEIAERVCWGAARASYIVNSVTGDIIYRNDVPVPAAPIHDMDELVVISSVTASWPVR